MNQQTAEQLARLQQLGISWNDAMALRRISMTLHRWFELECGDGRQWIERDEVTNKPYLYIDGNYLDPKPRRYATADRETGARKRLAAIMTKYPELLAYVQTDPRGAALYILRTSDIPAGEAVECVYNRGVAVFK